MWIGIKSEWHKSHTELSKYFIERVKQKVDSAEIVSNKHKTTNGFTLIDEIIYVAELVKKRNKFKRRLISLVDESKCSKLPNSVVNDYIIVKYFPDIKEYFLKFSLDLTISDRTLSNLILKLKVFRNRLKNYYYEYLKKEFAQIDFKTSTQFKRNAELLDTLIELWVPYILYYGYSTISVSNISYRFVSKDKGYLSPQRIISHFSGRESDLKFLLHGSKDSKEFSYIKNNLNKEMFNLKIVSYDEVKKQIRPNIRIRKDSELIQLSHKTIDPHNFLRGIYDHGLKRFVASKNRLSLSHFNNFFDNSYWKFAKANNHLYDKSKFSYDPINVVERVSTLHSTLKRVSKDYELEFKGNEELPIISQLHQPIYFYNLALGSKSIENSMSMLWTSLESLIPYRLKESDIDNVKYFVGKSLALGAFSRDLMSLIGRTVELNNLENKCLRGLGLEVAYIEHTPKSMAKWATWLTQKFDSTNDPYKIFKNQSNLLCNTFCDLNDTFNGSNKKSKVSNWLSRIDSSRLSIEYQLDRIYLHRNQIVHAGKFINEYSNLWLILEWYVGKLLAYAFIRLLKNRSITLEDCFLELESDYDQIINLLDVNKDKKIKDLTSSFEILYKHPWQSF